MDARIAAGIAGTVPYRTYEALEQLTDGDVLEETTGNARNRVRLAVDIIDELAESEQRIQNTKTRDLSRVSLWP